MGQYQSFYEPFSPPPSVQYYRLACPKSLYNHRIPHTGMIPSYVLSRQGSADQYQYQEQHSHWNYIHIIIYKRHCEAEQHKDRSDWKCSINSAWLHDSFLTNISHRIKI